MRKSSPLTRQALGQSDVVITLWSTRCLQVTCNLATWHTAARSRFFTLLFLYSAFFLVSENEYELYKNTDLRPPFTYATLIRQVWQVFLNFLFAFFYFVFAGPVLMDKQRFHGISMLHIDLNNLIQVIQFSIRVWSFYQVKYACFPVVLVVSWF